MSIKNEISIPKGYKSSLSIRETELAIKLIKDFFEHDLAYRLHLTRVSAPLFVKPSTGLNDNLNGIERPVAFDVKDLDGDMVEVVQSLAKWKRDALKRYGFMTNEGLYTDMNAIRRDEETDNLHSIYVDQWDWEISIEKSQRTLDTLQRTVKEIYQTMRDTEILINQKYPEIIPVLPEEIFFITTQELEDAYPKLDPKQREDAICLKKKAVFLMQIGGKLKGGDKHDGRAPDYDDWSLNGDILLYNPLLERAFEISSMGVRVDEEALLKQLTLANCLDRLNFPFHQAILNQKLPYSIGGGIGQSRLCMFFLRKAHIGEVQASVWPLETETFCLKHHINLL